MSVDWWLTLLDFHSRWIEDFFGDMAKKEEMLLAEFKDRVQLCAYMATATVPSMENLG